MSPAPRHKNKTLSTFLAAVGGSIGPAPLLSLRQP
ncbi:hypothetical protein J2S30_005298 [Herbaspirillum rubrisubalbicans]|nr:hypothetical protein [Herbaspirillum rubrisubalbicans]